MTTKKPHTGNYFKKIVHPFKRLSAQQQLPPKKLLKLLFFTMLRTLAIQQSL